MSAIGPWRTYASLVVKKTRVGHESFRFCMHCSSGHRSHWRVCTRRHTRFRGSGIFDFGCASWFIVHVSPVVRFWPLADIPYVAFDVAFGGKADMPFCTAYVRL